MGLKLENPAVVGRVGDALLLIEKDGGNNTDAQMWRPDTGYSEVKPLQVWLKFLYYVDEVNPPESWSEPG